MADAIHDLGDSLSIGLAWVLNRLGKKPADDQYSYGYRRFTLLGAVINGLILTIGSIWILTESIPRLFSPEMPVVSGMFGLAILGVIVNGFAAYKMSHGTSMAERMLNWHLIEDVLGWVAVLVVSIILFFYPLPIFDPLLSLAFTLYILINVGKTLWQAIRVFLQATPNKEDFVAIANNIISLPHVADVHHLHIWSLDGTRNVLTAHLVMKDFITLTEQKQLKKQIGQVLETYHFVHTTIELEFSDELCRDQSLSH
jgi:cobalt-zinc-cadmium efflux system protein